MKSYLKWERNKMEALTQDEWINENIDYLKKEYKELKEFDDHIVKCKLCDGSGEIVCDECGYEHECEECEGSGKIVVNFNDFCDKAYIMQRDADQKKLSKYYNSLSSKEKIISKLSSKMREIIDIST